jgi:hypothetical protein
MENTAPSAMKMLSYGFVAFVIALPGMILVYEWVV